MKPVPSHEDLCVRMPWGTIEPLSSNDLPWCLDCGEPITEENDSGWEAFTAESGGTKSQALCKACDHQRGIGPQVKAGV